MRIFGNRFLTLSFIFLLFLAVYPVLGEESVNPAAVGDGWGNTPNRFTGTDSERIAAAVAEAPKYGGIVRIPPRTPDAVSDRNYWLIDSAILLPGETTLYLDNCKIKLSDQSRDNIIRSANCGLGIDPVEPVENIHVIGIGNPILEGADVPRATGDGGKQLTVRSFGTDTGKEGESQFGDWRNIGVLMAKVKYFTLTNITLRETHAWGVSFERSSYGRITDLRFYDSLPRVINGEEVNVLNQDGVDLRRGCNHIRIENITGQTGDDLVALTAIRRILFPGGSLQKTEVSGNHEGEDNDIHHIIIRNVAGHAGDDQLVRVLNAEGIKIHHVIIDGVIENSLNGHYDNVALKIGDNYAGWGGPTPLGDTYGFQISNIQSEARVGVLIQGSLTDSMISGVINYNPEAKAVKLSVGEEQLRNVIIQNVIDAFPKEAE